MKKYKIKVEEEETGVEILSVVEVFTDDESKIGDKLMEGFEEIMKKMGLGHENSILVWFPKDSLDAIPDEGEKNE